MRVTVEVAGEDTHELDVPDDATYADLLASIELSPHEVSIVVDEQTVPTDQRVESDHVTVVRLIKGG